MSAPRATSPENAKEARGGQNWPRFSDRAAPAVCSPAKRNQFFDATCRYCLLPAAAVILLTILGLHCFLHSDQVFMLGIRSYKYSMQSFVQTGQEDLEDLRWQQADPLKVWVYPLQRKYTFSLGITSCRSTECYLEEPNIDDAWDWSEPPRSTLGGLFRQHSVDWYLAADMMGPREGRDPRSVAVRVDNPLEADVFFVPFFSSFSNNLFGTHMREPGLDLQYQMEVADLVLSSPHWRRRGGIDHVILAHHPNSFRFRRAELAAATFILADFARYNQSVLSLSKDVIAPYVHMVKSMVHDDDAEEAWSSRNTLLFFQGRLQRKPEFGGYVRQELMRVLEGEEGVVFAEGPQNITVGVQHSTSLMQNSRFCLHLAGDTPTSCRLFDAIVSHCVPVIISDYVELPFEDSINYRKLAIFVSTANALKPKKLIKKLRAVSQKQWTRMWRHLKEVQQHFEYQYPAQHKDAVNMIWRSVKRVAAQRRLVDHRRKRLVVPDWTETTP